MSNDKKVLIMLRCNKEENVAAVMAAVVKRHNERPTQASQEFIEAFIRMAPPSFRITEAK